MTNENEKRGYKWKWWEWIIVIVGLSFMFCLFYAQCRADSAFVAIEKAKPRVCQYVCPICKNCYPEPASPAIGYFTTGLMERGLI